MNQLKIFVGLGVDENPFRVRVGMSFDVDSDEQVKDVLIDQIADEIKRKIKDKEYEVID